MRPFGFGPRLRGGPPAHLIRPPSIRLNHPSQNQSVSEPVVVAACGDPRTGPSNLNVNKTSVNGSLQPINPLPATKQSGDPSIGRKNEIMVIRRKDIVAL